MKTEDGHLVPVPEKPKRSECSKTKTEEKRESATREKKRDHSLTNMSEQVASVDLQLQSQPLSSSEENSECPSMSLEFTNLSVIDSIPQVLSLVDINTGQVLTVEVTNPELLSTNELADQFGANCNEMLNLSDYQDMEFQNSLLNTDQTYYDNTDYPEVALENIEDPSSLMNNNSKIETIESYLTHGFPPFLNL